MGRSVRCTRYRATGRFPLRCVRRANWWRRARQRWVWVWGSAWVVMELAPDGVLVNDDYGRIMMANRHIETLFGHDRDSVIGMQVERLSSRPLAWGASPAPRPVSVSAEGPGDGCGT